MLSEEILDMQFERIKNLVPENSRWRCAGTPCREGCAVPGKANDVTGLSGVTAVTLSPPKTPRRLGCRVPVPAAYSSQYTVRGQGVSQEADGIDIIWVVLNGSSRRSSDTMESPLPGK